MKVVSSVSLPKPCRPQMDLQGIEPMRTGEGLGQFRSDVMDLAVRQPIPRSESRAGFSREWPFGGNVATPIPQGANVTASRKPVVSQSEKTGSRASDRLRVSVCRYNRQKRKSTIPPIWETERERETTTLQGRLPGELKAGSRTEDALERRGAETGRRARRRRVVMSCRRRRQPLIR